MVVVGYGIAALIVIALLIVFNVRAVSSRNPQSEPDTPQAPPAELPVSEPEVVAAPAERVDSHDQNYRNAMRSMKSGQPAGHPAAVPASKNKSSDAEYREAMRNLRKTPDRKE